MALAYQIIFSADETYNMAKQANERIKYTVSYYVNHFYKLILTKILGGEFTANINFKNLDEENVDKFLEKGTIVRVSRNANDKKCLGHFSDFRKGIITSVLENKDDKRYLIKVIGEIACAPSYMPTNEYESEKTYLRSLFPISKKCIGRQGTYLPRMDEEKLHFISSTLYSTDELEVGSFEERYKIITETMDELERMLGITIIKSGPHSSSFYEGKVADYIYKISWKSKEEQKEEEKPLFLPSEEQEDKEYAELYNLWQLSSMPEKEEVKMKTDYFPTVKLKDLDFDKLKVLPEKDDKPFDSNPIFITLTTAAI